MQVTLLPIYYILVSPEILHCDSCMKKKSRGPTLKFLWDVLWKKCSHADINIANATEQVAE